MDDYKIPTTQQFTKLSNDIEDVATRSKTLKITRNTVHPWLDLGLISPEYSNPLA